MGPTRSSSEAASAHRVNRLESSFASTTAVVNFCAADHECDLQHHECGQFVLETTTVVNFCAADPECEQTTTVVKAEWGVSYGCTHPIAI